MDGGLDPPGILVIHDLTLIAYHACHVTVADPSMLRHNPYPLSPMPAHSCASILIA